MKQVLQFISITPDGIHGHVGMRRGASCHLLVLSAKQQGRHWHMIIKGRVTEKKSLNVLYTSNDMFLGRVSRKCH